MRHLLIPLVLVAGCASGPRDPQLPVDEKFLPLDKDVQVRREGAWDHVPNRRHFWVRVRNPDDNTEMVAEMIIDCHSKSSKQLSSVQYNAKGATAYSWNTPRREFDPLSAEGVVPGSNMDSVMNYVCADPAG